MFEILPIAAGIAFALGMLRWGPRTSSSRWLVSAVYSLVVGVIVAAVAGELAESWAFALLDAAMTLAAIVLTTVALRQVGLAGERSKARI